MKQKQLKLALLNAITKVKNITLYYIFTLIRHPLFLCFIIIIIYILVFIYFFADPVLCQGSEGNLGESLNAPQSNEGLIYDSQASQEASALTSYEVQQQEAIALQNRVNELEDSIEHYTSQGNKCEKEYKH